MKILIDTSVLHHNRNFRLLYLGQFISFIGTMITQVALPYQIYHITQSTLMVGLLSLFQLLPLIITSLLGGVIADRYHRRQILLLAESVLSLSCLFLIINANLNPPHIWVLFVVASLMSGLVGLHHPARESIYSTNRQKRRLPKYRCPFLFHVQQCHDCRPFYWRLNYRAFWA
jgi:MFS family permease